MKQAENTITFTITEEQIWENLNISNDFMFAKVMRNPELCRGMLERLLGITIDHIEYPEEQKVIDIAKDSKSVRLDVYLKDEKGVIYNVEIQTTNSKNLPKRTRYYQGMIDLNAIEKGADYSELPKSFIIFICTFDVFGKKRWKYTFQNICKEDSQINLEDDIIKIFFNTKGKKGNISQDTKRILKFIESNTVEDDFTKKLAEEVQRIGEIVGEACGRAEGEVHGRAEAIIEFALELGYTDEAILSVLQKKLNMNVNQAEDYLKRYYEKTL